MELLKALFPRLFGNESITMRERTITPRVECPSCTEESLKKSKIPKELIEKAQELARAGENWARAYCLPEEKENIPEEEMTPEQKRCVENLAESYLEQVREELM